MRYLILLILLSGCYTRKKANDQHGRAVSTYPEIAADYCARIYPPKDSLIKGDSIFVSDTIYTGGNVSFDTTIIMDTKYITKTIQLPGTKIIERITIHDTVVRVNSAEVDLWRIQANKALDIATDKTKEAADFKKSRNKWRLIAIGLMVAMALGIVAMLRRKAAKVLP